MRQIALNYCRAYAQRGDAPHSMINMGYAAKSKGAGDSWRMVRIDADYPHITVQIDERRERFKIAELFADIQREAPVQLRLL